MSKQEMEPPKPLTTEEIMGDWDERMEKILSDIAEMKAKMIECLKTGPQPSDVQEEVAQLKQEIVELKKENANLKQQISDLWDKFTSFIDKHATAASQKWSAFFSKKKETTSEPKANESSNGLGL